jgi:hypothetical protein
VSFELSAVSIECKVLGGYPNGRVFGGQDLARNPREKKVGINPIVWNANRAELYDNLFNAPFGLYDSPERSRIFFETWPDEPSEEFLFLFGNRIERTLCGRRFQFKSPPEVIASLS